MKKIVLLGIISAILVAAGIAIAGEYGVVNPENSGKSGVMKRVIADTIAKKDIDFFKAKGCLIRHRLKDVTSLDCPQEVIPILNVRESRIFQIMDLKADQQIGADKVWAEGIDGSGVTVAVLDTGVQADHEELADSIVGCESFVAGETCEDLNGHGTHVAGIITANGVYEIDSNKATGVAPGTDVYMLKVCGTDGYCWEDDMMAAMEYVVNNEIAEVMSISIGGGLYTGENCDTDPLAAKVNWVVNQGITVAVAAGNDPNGISSPGCASGAIAVGAVDKEGYVAHWSGRGSALDIVAPGVDILSTYSCLAPGAEDCTKTWYAYMSGTSMATPHIAGVAALLLQTNSSIAVDDIKTALYSTADPSAGSIECQWYWRGRCIRPTTVPSAPEDEGAGIVNAYGAYLAIQPTGPACFSAVECDDGNPCTDDVCVNPGKAEASCENTPVADGITCDDGQFCTVSDICTAGVCEGAARDCSDGVACTADSCDEAIGACVNTPDNSYCDDGLYCNGAEYCDVVEGCQPGTPVDCNDNNPCTIDSCDETTKSCLNEPVVNDIPCSTDEGEGVCCSGECMIGVAECPTAVMCWSGESGDYQYLYRNNSQAKKFCKCAQGTYGYQSYSRKWARATVYEYVDTGDNENWEVSSRSSYLPVYQVKCTDGLSYPTNQDYYYGK